METSLTDSRPSLSNSRLYSLLVDILIDIYSSSQSGDTVYRRLVDGITKLVLDSLEYLNSRCGLDVRLIRLVTSLGNDVAVSNQQLNIPGNKKSVKFSSTENINKNGGNNEAKVQTLSLSSVATNVLFSDPDATLWHLVYESTRYTLARCSKDHSDPGSLRYFGSVLNRFVSPKLLRYLVAETNPGFSDTTGTESNFGFFRHVLLPWVTRPGLTDVDGVLGSVLRTVFTGLEELPDKERLLEDVIVKLKEDTENEILLEFMSSVIDTLPAELINWLTVNERFNELTSGLTDELFRQQSNLNEDKLRIIVNCLSSGLSIISFLF